MFENSFLVYNCTGIFTIIVINFFAGDEKNANWVNIGYPRHILLVQKILSADEVNFYMDMSET